MKFMRILWILVCTLVFFSCEQAKLLSYKVENTKNISEKNTTNVSSGSKKTLTDADVTSKKTDSELVSQP